MKITGVAGAVLQLHWLFASTASAYWIRGAAERALYYSVYVLEDIHFNKDAYDGWKIAPDCVGSRKGMWQKNRCNLAEFLNEIWKPTGTPPDTRPPAADINWPKTMAGASTTQSIVSFIMSATYNDGTQVCRKDTTPKQYGYTGNTDEENKLWKGSGINNYWDSLEAFGPRAVALKKDFDEAIKKGDIVTDPADTKKYKAHKIVIDKFNNFYKEATVAAEVIVDFRVQDKWRHLKDMGDWKNKLGVDGVWEEKSSKHSWIGAWEEINKGKTIDQMVAAGQDRDAATKKYDEHWASLNSSDQSKAHNSAIEKGKSTLKSLTSAPCP